MGNRAIEMVVPCDGAGSESRRRNGGNIEADGRSFASGAGARGSGTLRRELLSATGCIK